MASMPDTFELISNIKGIHNGIATGTCPECAQPHPCRTYAYVDGLLASRFED